MNEIETLVKMQTAAILALQAQTMALRGMVGNLLADNANALHLTRMHAGMVEDQAMMMLISDDQITQVRAEYDAVLEAVDAFHARCGIDSRPEGVKAMADPEPSFPTPLRARAWVKVRSWWTSLRG